MKSRNIQIYMYIYIRDIFRGAMGVKPPPLGRKNLKNLSPITKYALRYRVPHEILQ